MSQPYNKRVMQTLQSRRNLLKFLAASPVAASLPLLESQDTPSVIGNPKEALNVLDFEPAAKKAIPPAHFGYMATGVDDEATLRANREGFRKIQLRPRRMVDVSRADLSVDVLGTRWETPIFICPCGSQKAFHPDGEMAVAAAANSRKTLQVLSTVSTSPIEDVIRANGKPIWFQLYLTSRWQNTEKLVAHAEAAGCPVLVVTVDLTVGRNTETAERSKHLDARQCSACHPPGPQRSYTRYPMFQGVDMNGVYIYNPAMSWDMVARLKKFTRMKIVLKGIETGEDARLSRENGADAIILSNHGGRAEESGRGTIECLPEVVDGAGNLPVLIDGGFRRGTDIYKALALGARAVGVGRPYLWGLGAFGQPGVERVLDILRTELELTMKQCGRRSIAEIDHASIFPNCRRCVLPVDYTEQSDWIGDLHMVLGKLWLFLLAGALLAQTPAKVDFSKDVLPILRQNCESCHGSAQQTGGLRLDRKSSALSRNTVVPGKSADSFLYSRISGTNHGMQMPPTGPLRPEQIDIIKRWIDEGAEWPDSLANEAPPPPIDLKAVTLVEALHNGDLPGFLKVVAENPKLLNARGPEGSTPFMYAVLYTTAPVIQKLLEQGADPNKRNDANATALMWAASDLEKIRVLLKHGAEVNARSNDLRTPLIIAARRPANLGAVTLLLESGANPNPNAHPATESSPLIEAATAGDAASMKLLLGRGAEVKESGEQALEMAITVRCLQCVALLVAKGLSKAAYTEALPNIATLADANTVRLMLDHGADVDKFDSFGRTPLMYAAASDLLNLDVVKLLVERGANVNAKDIHKQSGDTGMTVLDIAQLHGETPVTAWLVHAGAKGSAPRQITLKGMRENTVASAVQVSLPLIQKADATFIPKAACASCHNNSLGAMAVSAARNSGYAVDEKTAAQQVKANVFGLEKLRDKMHQGFFLPVGDFFAPGIVAYMLVGLEGEHYKPDLNTDAVAMYLKSLQAPDGQWPYAVAETRPPLCADYIGQTALSMRVLQLYAPVAEKAAYERSVQLAAGWLKTAQPNNNDDRGWRLVGLAWAGNDRPAVQTAMKDLLAVQKADGGWSDIESMESSAYSTGKALVALHTAGLPPSDAAYSRAVQFLLKTQQEDGSWYVRTRAMGFQPYFDAGFPYNIDQWISVAGTSWATMALSLTAPAHATVAAR